MKHKTKIQTPKTTIIFSNGNTGCFDANGEQIVKLQKKGTIELWFEWLEKKGVDPTKIEKIETTVNGRECLLKPFKTKYGWNYQIVDNPK